MKGFYSEYRAFNSLAPINAPTSTARAFNVVTIWSTHGRFHAGPTLVFLVRQEVLVFLASFLFRLFAVMISLLDFIDHSYSNHQ